MKWQGKELADLTPDELAQAKSAVNTMWAHINNLRSDPRFEQRTQGNQPPINQDFIALKEALEKM